MGTWSAAINGNDDFMTVYEAFRELYSEHDGKKWVYELPEIKKKMNEQFSFQLGNDELAAEFWFAQAKSFWDFGIDDDSALKKVKKIIESGSDLETWKNLSADEKALVKRKKILDEFLQKISKRNPKPVARKKVKKTEPPFGVGDLITFTDDKENYYGAVITQAYRDEKGRCIVHLLNYCSKKKPGRNNLINAGLMINNKSSGQYSSSEWANPVNTNIYGFLLTAKGFQQRKVEFEKIGEVAFHEYGYYKDGLRSFCDMAKYSWDILPSLAALNYDDKPAKKPAVLNFFTTETAFSNKEVAIIMDSFRKEKAVTVLTEQFKPKDMVAWAVYLSFRDKVSISIGIRGYDKMNPFHIPNILSRVFGQWLATLKLVIDSYAFSVQEYEIIPMDSLQEYYKSMSDAISHIEKMKK